jgi:1-acyl-sn-glycerol-3-phosphate acyltransferase
MLLATGMIPVDRGAGANALRGLLRATDQARLADRQIVIFPEGTRVAYGEHVPLQPGIAAIAARQKLPVLPVATDSGRLWGRRSFRKYPGTLHIAIGAPIGPDIPRPQLMSQLELFWRAAERNNFGCVDNAFADTVYVDKSGGITLDERASTMK